MGKNGSCDIVDYKISKVVDNGTSALQASSWYDDKFEINSNGIFKVTGFDSNYTMQKIYVEPKNNNIWSM